MTHRFKGPILTTGVMLGLLEQIAVDIVTQRSPRPSSSPAV